MKRKTPYNTGFAPDSSGSGGSAAKAGQAVLRSEASVCARGKVMCFLP